MGFWSGSLWGQPDVFWDWFWLIVLLVLWKLFWPLYTRDAIKDYYTDKLVERGHDANEAETIVKDNEHIISTFYYAFMIVIVISVNAWRDIWTFEITLLGLTWAGFLALVAWGSHTKFLGKFLGKTEVRLHQFFKKNQQVTGFPTHGHGQMFLGRSSHAISHTNFFYDYETNDKWCLPNSELRNFIICNHDDAPFRYETLLFDRDPNLTTEIQKETILGLIADTKLEFVAKLRSEAIIKEGVVIARSDQEWLANTYGRAGERDWVEMVHPNKKAMIPLIRYDGDLIKVKVPVRNYLDGIHLRDELSRAGLVFRHKEVATNAEETKRKQEQRLGLEP